MAVRLRIDDGPGRFIANGSMPQLPLCTHCLGPTPDGSGERKAKVSPTIPAQTCPRAVTASLDLRQRKPTIFRKPTGGVSK